MKSSFISVAIIQLFFLCGQMKSYPLADRGGQASPDEILCLPSCCKMPASSLLLSNLLQNTGSNLTLFLHQSAVNLDCYTPRMMDAICLYVDRGHNRLKQQQMQIHQLSFLKTRGA